MTNLEAVSLLKFLQETYVSEKDYNVNMAIIKAEEQLEKTKEALNRIVKPSKEFSKVDAEKINILKKYAEKDGKNFKLNKSKTDFVYKDEKKKDNEINAFLKKHKKLYDEQKEKDRLYREALQERTDYKKVKVRSEVMDKLLRKDFETNEFRIIYKLFEIE